MSVRLSIIRGPQSGRSFEFDDDEITIGSGRNNHITILDNDVSTHHCRLLRVEKDYDIEDLGSRYGTFANGQRITDKAFTLPSPSIVELGGQIALEYERVHEDAEAVVRPGLFMIDGDPGSQPVLIHIEDGVIKDAFLLQSEEITVGRSTENDIIIQEIDISRRHFKLTWQGKRFHVEDMGSRNGTFLNNDLLEGPRPVQHSDVIRMGSTVNLHLVFRSDLPTSWNRQSSASLPNAENMKETDYTLPRSPINPEGTKRLTQTMREGELNEHIFMAYAREDWEDIVASIVLNLNDSKQNVWVPQHLSIGSEAWNKAVEQAHRECWLLIVVVSEAAMRSSFVRDQYRYFYNREKPIILVDYKPIDPLPVQLTRVPRILYDADQPGLMFQRLLFEILNLKPRYMA
jgi:pSer/pThr/pTyr-binding forkhead associated (FHA) protein